jgi:hypothetical protein
MGNSSGDVGKNEDNEKGIKGSKLVQELKEGATTFDSGYDPKRGDDYIGSSGP